MRHHKCQYGQPSDLAVVITYAQYRTVWCFNYTVTLRIHCISGQITFSFCTGLKNVVVVADAAFVVVGLF